MNNAAPGVDVQGCSNALPETDLGHLLSFQPAGMVVHISAGHHSGTLVNALLYHCGLPGLSVDQVPSGALQKDEEATSNSTGRRLEAGSSEMVDLGEGPSTNGHDDVVDEDEDDTEVGGLMLSGGLSASQGASGILRPGIVHRLDKGTTGKGVRHDPVPLFSSHMYTGSCHPRPFAH